MQPPPEILARFPNRYISILRCSTWCNWPKNEHWISPAIQTRMGCQNNEDDTILYSLIICSYEPRPRPEICPPEETVLGPIVWDGKLNSGYIVGNTFFKTPEDTIPVSCKHTHPFQGEIDIQLHIAGQKLLSDDDLLRFASPISFSILSYINMVNGDTLIPTAPLHISSINEQGQRIFSNPLRFYVSTRRN